ncbi:13073_t:CDS:1, partial [Racocetra persica]
LYINSDIARAYEVCDEEQVDKLRLQIAKGHYDKKEYEKAWTIFSEINNCKFRPTHYSSQSHNIFKFTDKFWITIYILENFYKENTNKINEKFKDLYLLKKANTCQQRMKYIDEWKLLSEVSENKTEYYYDAKF